MREEEDVFIAIHKGRHWIVVMCSAAMILTTFSSLSLAGVVYPLEIYVEQETLYFELESRAADIWGTDNVWLPSPKQWVQYEHDLGERSMVDFETGEVCVQIVIKADDDPNRRLVLAHLRQGVGNLIQGEARDPLEMMNALMTGKKPTVKQKASPKKTRYGKEVRVYLLRKGDSLWKVARRFRMSLAELAKLNDIPVDASVSVGQPLKVKVMVSHDLTLDTSPRSSGQDSLILDQIRMVDGSPVPRSMVRDFAAEVVGSHSRNGEKVVGADGFERQVVTVKFKLVSNHLEIRARKFHPLVIRYAEKYILDPAVIMAIIHTESRFNPRAQSPTPAYGLMQLVPDSGASDAYRRVYGERRKLTAQYLYDPKNNIELGVAYFNILKNNYMKSIQDPASRTYCAVAAYNAGAANVGGAFIEKKSINLATPVINLMKPKAVYSHLVEELPFKESRKYVKKVINRRNIYRQWEPQQAVR
jgi:LysM repeat protein